MFTLKALKYLLLNEKIDYSMEKCPGVFNHRGKRHMIKKGTQVQEYRSYTVSLDTIFRLDFRDTKPRKTAVAQSEIQ